MRAAKWLLIGVLAVGLAACSSRPEPEESGNDKTGENKNGNEEQEGGSELRISALLRAVEKDVENRPILRGSVEVTEGQYTEIHDAVLKVNGVEIPVEENLAGDKFYALETANISGVGLGSTIEVVAERGGERASLTLECPGGVELVAPEDGTKVVVGEEIEFEWNGDFFNDEVTAHVRIAPWNSTEKSFGNIRPPPEGVNKDQPARYTVPSRDADQDSWIASMSLIGRATDTDDGYGHCTYEFVRQLLPQD